MKRNRLLLSSLLCISLLFSACSKKPEKTNQTSGKQSAPASSADVSSSATPTTADASSSASVTVPDASSSATANVENPDRTKVFSIANPPKGIVPIEDWQPHFPAQVASFKQNEEMLATAYGGSVNVDYLELYPFLKTLYAGYGFSKQYDRARGHVYALEDVLSTARPKKGASCLACKTSQFNEALMKDRSVSMANFDAFAQEHVTVGMTCYDCHGETPGIVQVARDHLLQALDNNSVSQALPARELACAQCHVEYYMTVDENEVRLPWADGLGCEEAYEYYEELGFTDWEHPGTGAKLLKAQHPETETFEGSVHEKKGLDCAVCHMPQVTVEGQNTKSHHWTSPLKSVELSCLKCHNDQTAEGLTQHVEAIQKEVHDRTVAIGEELTAFVEKLSAAVTANTLADQDLEQLRRVHREAQFYWDYVFVENSEGFHNAEKQMDYLEHAHELVEEAMKKLPA